MSRRTFEGTGILPGMDDDPRPAPKDASRDAKIPGASSGRVQRRQASTARIAGPVIALAVVMFCALFAFYRIEQFMIRDDRFALNGPDGSPDTPTLEIDGAVHASRNRVETVFASDAGRSVFLMPLKERRGTLRSIDWVKDASVARIWPNRVIVHVSERKPVAFVTLAASRFGLIDEDGVILPPVEDKFNLPVLAGVRASDPVTQRRECVHRMLRLTKDLGDISKISQIDVSDPDNLKITQPSDGHLVTLYLGDRDFALRYQNFMRNFPEIKKRLPDAATLDMRLEDRITVVE
ncbi:MAG: cell division protein FtsQ/DivIB [Bryobacteraceae bacterium]